MTSSMLDTPSQDKLDKNLHVFNAFEQSYIMMIMGGSNKPRTEYNLEAYYTSHKLCIITGNSNIRQLKFPPNNAGRPIRQFKCPLSWLNWRAGSHPVRFCFLVRWEASVRGAQTPTQGSRHVLTEWGNTPTRHTSTEKYTSENIYARSQWSVGYLAR